MRFLPPKTVFALVVLIAAPLLGFGGRVHAGILAVETLPRATEPSFFASPSVGSDWYSDLHEEQSGPCITQGPEPTDPAASTTRLATTAAASTLPGVPGQPLTELVSVHRGQPIYSETRTTVPPAGLASLFLSGPRTQLPDPLLSRLFRPPR